MKFVSPMGQLRPFFVDKNGKRLAGGEVYTYEAGTLTPKNTFRDGAGAIPNTNPIILDGSGEADIYLSGFYRFRVLDRQGNLIFDVDDFKTLDEINLAVLNDAVQQTQELRNNAAGLVSEAEVLLSNTTEQANAAEVAATNATTQVDGLKGYVDSALTGLSFANKTYATLAAANADIANIAVNQSVWVSSATEGGLYEKKTAGATSLSKSAYDPLTMAKKALLNVFDSHAGLVAANIPRYNYAVVVNDPDPTKNGYYQKQVDDSLGFLRYNTPAQVQDYLSKNGFAQVQLLSDANANYTTADTTLTITGTGYATTNKGTFVLATPIALAFPSNAPYRLEFNETTKKLRVVHVGTDKETNWLPCGYIRKEFSGLTTDVFKNIRVNGTLPMSNAKPNYSLMLTKASTLNFDFNSNKIIVSGNLWIQYDGGRIQVTAQEIALDPARNKGFAQILLVNPADSSMYVKSQAAPYTVPKDHLQVGAYYENDQIFFGLDHFSVNGKPFQQTASVRPSFGWDFNNKVDVNVVDSLMETDPLYMANLTTAIVYGWFDQLATDFPDYITKTTLGNDATGTLPIYQYRFKPKLPNPQNAGLNTKIPKVMLLTIHNEGMNMVALHIMMREICRSWQSSEALESMRHGLEFVVIPVGNPWGLNNGKRTNSNQIDINRQFPTEWVQLGVPGDYFYSGTSALSEAEAQHLYAAMVAERPDVYFDVHSYGSWNNDGTSAWLPILNDKTNSAIISAMTRIYAQYKKKYSWLADIDKLFDVSNEKLLGGGTSSKSAASLGAIGGTFESSWNLKNSPDGEPRGHTPAINFSADLLATCVLQSIGVVISSK